MNTAERIAGDVARFLDLAHRPVGIRIEEGARRTRPPSTPLRFCILEREDLHSGSREFVSGDIECPGASLALGMVEPVRVDVQPRIQVSVSSVRVGPVEGADQVLFTVTPSQAMVLAVLIGGIEAHCTATHAVCGEVVARVHETGRPHLSLLCPGMRELCGFRDDELVVGIAHDDLVALPAAMAHHASLSLARHPGSRSPHGGD